MKKITIITIGRINSGNFGVNNDITFKDGKRLCEFFTHSVSRGGNGHNDIYTLPVSYVEEIADYNKNKGANTTFDVKEKEFRRLFQTPGIAALNMFD